jgi:3-hydroxyanthranilate 3,4-dioxygenase
MVVERQRNPGETEALRWYCERCGEILHEARMRVTDLGVQLKPVIERFYADESLRTCGQCGAVAPPPAPAR